MLDVRSRLCKGRWRLIQFAAVIAVLVASVVWAGTSQATPGSGVTLETLGNGVVLPQAVQLKVKAKNYEGSPNTFIDVARVQQYKITIAPGGTTGWHQHGGPHLIVVSSGTLTYYKGDDPTCTGITYPAGTTVFDPGFTTHLARNEGAVDVVNFVTQMLPDPGGIFRIDVPMPGNPACGF